VERTLLIDVTTRERVIEIRSGSVFGMPFAVVVVAGGAGVWWWCRVVVLVSSGME